MILNKESALVSQMSITCCISMKFGTPQGAMKHILSRRARIGADEATKVKFSLNIVDEDDF